MDQDAHMRRIIDNLSTDLNNLSSETKRKFAPVKEACEACLLKLRQINSLKTNLYKTMCDSSVDVLKPLILGCETKQPKIIQICLNSVQKVIEAKILNTNSASNLIGTLWLLTDSSLEELKVLQTIILLVTTTDVVKHQLLAKTLSIGLRIASSKDQILVNTATAMLSQMVTKVFERVLIENKQQQQQQTTANANNLKQIDFDQLKVLSREAPSWMNESSQDAYMLLQDIYLLLNSDQSLWLVGINDINKPFGLELLKSILIRYPEIFFNNPEMCFILKERICPLLIKLFSPSTKLKLNLSSSGSPSSSVSSAQSSSSDQQKQAASSSPSSFPIVSRLIRIVHVLIKSYFELLITESEIFLSLLTKLLDMDSRPVWQKALVIECLHKIALEPRLIQLIVTNYDMQPHPEKIFHLMCQGIALFIQSLFLSAACNNSSSSSSSSGGASSMSGGASGGGGGGGSMGSSITGGSLSSSSSTITSSLSMTSSGSTATSSQQQQQPSFAFQISSAQPSFVYKDTTIQLLFPYVSGQIKSTYLDNWDKPDAPYIQDGYLLSIGFSALQELSKSVQTLIEQNLAQFHQQQQANEPPGEYPKAQVGSPLKRLNLSELQLSTSAPLLECLQIMSSCCNSFLFVYNVLLESSLDETITEQIVKSIRAFVYLCSLLGLNLQRDAFVTALCKAALPGNYAHCVLNLKALTDLNYLVQNPNSAMSGSSSNSSNTPPVYTKASQQPSGKPGVAAPYDDSSERQIQVVAVGPALAQPISTTTTSTSSSITATNASSSTPGLLMLYITAKNLLIMKSLLNMSHMYSELLGSSWYIVLNTLQHLTWALGLRPTLNSQGQLKHIAPVNSASGASVTGSGSSVSGANAGETMITTAIQTEVAFICNMLSKLFESTKTTSDQALGEIVDALIRLAIECADYAHMRAEPCCVFAIAKLYETTLANLARFQLFWQKVTLHLLCACKHSNAKYREWCVDSLCSMIRATFNSKYATTTTTGSMTTSNSSTNVASLSNTQSTTSPSTTTTTTNSTTAESTRDTILQPLCELSTIGFADVRQKQLECTLSILRLMGQHLHESWPLCLNIIGAIQREHTDTLIRSAFQCLQLVVTDFLSMIGARHLTQVIQVVAQFGSQEQDLNISLTAIVLLWNISDYMFQQADQLAAQTEAGTIRPVWMVLYGRLGQLCVDPRPAVRKSAAQTLFCTISSHGSVLGEAANFHWNDLVWKVLFPLLEQVRHGTLTASREKDKHANHPNFLMHHSRDTAEKQWAETTVLTLAGVTRVFNSKCAILMKLPDGEFHRMWLFLLRMIKSLALSRNSEIALSALRGFHELLGNQNYFGSGQQMSNSAAQTVAAAASAASVVLPAQGAANTSAGTNSGSNTLSKSNNKSSTSGPDASPINTPASNSSPATSNNNTPGTVNNQQQQLTKTVFDINEWLTAWQTWLEIGSSLVLDVNGTTTTSSESSSSSTSSPPSQPVSAAPAAPFWPPPTQTFLTCYVDLVQVIVDRLAPASKFAQKDFELFSTILDKLLAIPVLSNDYSSFILMHIDSNLTPLQNTSLNTIKHFIKMFKSLNDSGAFQTQFISLIFQRLLSFVLYACYTHTPKLAHFQQMTNGNGSAAGTTDSSNSGSSSKSRFANETVNVNFVPFGEKALLVATSLYEENASNEAVIDNNILKSIIQTLYVPLSLKYSCPNASTWKLSIECLFRILKKALPIAQKNKTAFENIWMDLAKTFEDFLFSKNISNSELPLETIQHDEMIDCQVIELIRDDILTHSHLMPAQFVQKVLNILNRGSIYSSTFDNFLDLDSTRKMREEFSKTCFETLLRFSFVNNGVVAANGQAIMVDTTNTGGHLNGTAAGDTNLNKMALTSMLGRCKDIVQRYAHDEKLSGNVPLPRARVNEMIGVLKALGTLISALKKAPKDAIPATIWNQVIGLYPLLVECTTSPSSQISACVKEALHNYFWLLKSP